MRRHQAFHRGPLRKTLCRRLRPRRRPRLAYCQECGAGTILQPHGPHLVRHGAGTISQTCLVQVVNHVVAMRCGLTPSHPFYIFFLTMEMRL
jgi:hypothetical protein